MDRFTKKDKVALERLLTLTSSPRMLPSLWQSYSKCTELWFLSTLSLERPCYMLLLTEHIFRVSACGRRVGYDLNKCCWKKKTIWNSATYSQLFLFPLLTPLSLHAHTRSQTDVVRSPPWATLTRKSELSFVLGLFCPFRVVLAGHITENSHAKWAEYFM